MGHNTIIKVALNATRFPRRTGRVMYASFDRGLSVKAPSTGITIEGYHYDPYELIPAAVIQVASSDEKNKLFEMIDQDKKSLKIIPGPGQAYLPGMEKSDVPDQDVLDRQRREKARSFIPLNTIAKRDGNDEDRPYYEDMYDWMMNYYKDWYKNLSPDQELQAKSFGRRIKIAGEMNPYIRGKTGDYSHTGDAIEEGIRVFDSLVDEAPPIDQDIMTYRGIPDLRSLISGGATNIKKGQIIHNKQYMSSSIDPDIPINSFMSTNNPEALLMRIVLPDGTRVAPVTAYNIYFDGTSKSSFVRGSSSGEHEMELTLPRDSKLRVVSEPHYEEFQSKGGSKQVRVADFELLPQPTPEESPELPHSDIASFDTGGKYGFYEDPEDVNFDDDDDDDDDPWEGYDPDDMKSEKESDLEKIFDDYQDDPGHDARTLAQIEKLKMELSDLDHTDHGDPDEFDYAMQKVIDKAEKLVQDAPDHTDELWSSFNPQQERDQALEKVDATISRYAQNHDTSHPMVAEYLKQLEFIRDQIATSADENLRDSYDHPVDYVTYLDKYLARARDISRVGHEIYREQLSGKPPLFLGDTLDHEQLVDWVKRKNEFDNHVEKLRQTNPELADRVQGLWDKATHGMTLDNASKTLMNKLDSAAEKYAAGHSPDMSGYGYPVLSQLEREVNYQALVHKSVTENIARAKAMGIFQGGDWSQENLKDWAYYHYQFNKNLSDYRKKQETDGNPILPQAAQAQIYWDRATKELSPSYETMSILDRLVNYASSLKAGHAHDYDLEDIKSRLNTQLIHEGSPLVKLEARLEKLNDQYQEANERFENSKYYHEDYSGYREKFQDYVKSKGISGTTAEHMKNLTPEAQEQVFAQAKNLLKNLQLATNGQLHPAQIWSHPVEEAKPDTKVMDQLRFKAAKQKIVGRFQDAIFTYNKLPHYDIAYHTHLNNLMQEAMTNYKEGPDQLHVMKDVVRRAEGLAQGEPGALALLYDPLPNYGKKLSQVAQFNLKVEQFNEAMAKKKDMVLHDEFWDYKSPAKMSFDFHGGTTEEKQAILDHMDKVIAKAKAPVDRPEPTNFLTTHFFNKKDWQDLYESKIKEYTDATDQYAATPGYDSKKHAELDEKFFLNSNPGNIAQKLQQGTPESNQEILDNFDKVIAHAKTLSGQASVPPVVAPQSEDTVYASYVANSKEKPMPDWQAMYDQTMGQSPEPEPTKATPTEKFSDYSAAQDVNKKLYHYESMPWVDPAQIDHFKDRYTKLETKWSQEPEGQKNDVHYIAKLTHLHNDIVKSREEHIDKLDKINNHAMDIHPKLASLQGVADLEEKFPQAMNQIHLDMENYKRSPHFDELHYGLLTDILDDTGKQWEDKKNHEDAHEELQGLMRFTKKAATDNGKLPHQTLSKDLPEPDLETKPSKALKHETYNSVNRHIMYSRDRRIKAALISASLLGSYR